MFMSISQTVVTDDEWAKVRTTLMPADKNHGARVQVSFGWATSLILSIDEAKRLFLELEISLREAHDEENANV